MTLSDRAIRRRIDAGDLTIGNLSLDAISAGDRWLQPASVDVRLDQHFAVLTASDESAVLDPRLDNRGLFTRVTVPDGPGGSIVVPPHGCLLGSTREYVSLPDDLIGQVHGKSSVGRLFLQVNCAAGLLAPGWRGHVTLEIANLSPHFWRLYPGMPIAQLTFSKVKGGVRRPYGSSDGLASQYQNQPRGPVLSRGHWLRRLGGPRPPVVPMDEETRAELPALSRVFISKTGVGAPGGEGWTEVGAAEAAVRLGS